MIPICRLIAVLVLLASSVGAQSLFNPRARVVVRELHAEEFEGDRVELFKLSPGAAVVRAAVTIDTAWSASNGFIVGVEGDNDKGYLNAGTISEKAVGDGVGFLQAEAGEYLTGSPGNLKRWNGIVTVSATIEARGGGDPVGSVRIYFFYIECP